MKRQTQLYLLIKDLLTAKPALRDSDRKLVWSVWMVTGYADNGMISLSNFLDAPSQDSITRIKRKIQVEQPELGPSKDVASYRKVLEQQKGHSALRTEVTYKSETLF